MTGKRRFCKDCEAWQRDGADGICRLTHPKPGILLQGGVYTIVWSRTKPDDGCCEGLPIVIEYSDSKS